MDTLTHAVSGALLYKGWNALRPSPLPKSAWAVPLVMLAANLPDADIFFASTPVDFLLLHRGITHALAAMPLMALLAALLFLPLWKTMGKQKTPICTFTQCYGLGFCLIALHVYLDCITTYGTMIFLPFSDYRVRLNGMFIVDVWLLIPMVLACCLPRIRDNSPPRSRNPAVRALLLGACAWMLLYPAFTVFWRAQLEGQELIALVDKAPLKPTVLPDALSPLHWRILYATQGVSLPLQGSAVLPAASPDTVSPTSPRPDIPLFPPETSVHQQALTAFAQPDGPLTNYPAANPQLTAHLSAQDRSCRVFFRFTLLPLQYTDSWEGGTEYIFYDLRFHTLVPFVHDMMQMRAGGRSGGVPFLLRVRLNHQGELTSVRMTFSGSGLDSGWKPPQTPQQATWAQWLVGL